jgi:hypothetical protein
VEQLRGRQRGVFVRSWAAVLLYVIFADAPIKVLTPRRHLASRVRVSKTGVCGADVLNGPVKCNCLVAPSVIGGAALLKRRPGIGEGPNQLGHCRNAAFSRNQS